MFTSQAEERLSEAIAKAQSGRTAEARKLLERIVEENPRLEMAWLWLVQVQTDPTEQIATLKKCLRHNPGSLHAQSGLDTIREEMRQARGAPPAGRLPPADEPSFSAEPESGARIERPASSRMLTCVVVGFIVCLVALTITAGVLVYPLVSEKLSALPMFAPSSTRTPTITRTFTPTLPPSITPTPSRTSTRKPSPTATPQPTDTFTPTASPTPTLYAGTAGPDDRAILFPAAAGCAAVRVFTSGGAPTPETDSAPADCKAAEIAPSGKKIAWISLASPEKLYIANLDGSGRRPVAEVAPYRGLSRTIWAFQWAPDSKSIAIVANAFLDASGGDPLLREDAGFLYLAQASGSGKPRRIQDLKLDPWQSLGIADAELLSWSPDSAWLALSYLVGAEAVSSPYAIRLSDARAMRLGAGHSGFHFDWSSDGGTLSYIDESAALTEWLPSGTVATKSWIVLQPFTGAAAATEPPAFIPLPAGSATAVFEGYSRSFGARWSPDDATFLVFRYDTGELLVVSAGGKITARIQATSAPQKPDAPDGLVRAGWSPDGRWIWFVEPSDSGGRLVIVRPDGSDRRTLAEGVGAGPIIWP